MTQSAPSYKIHGRIAREDVESGLLEEMVAEMEQQGHFRRLPQPERDQSRWDILAKLPPDQDVWLFAYGSLIWSSMIEFVEQRQARLFGYHRQFSMWTKIGRGTPDCPGLTLALEAGGSCKGVAFRIAAKDVEQELKIIWNREMVSGSYTPKIIKLRTDDGPLQAIAFVMNHAHENFAGKLPLEEVARAIAGAEGPLGKCEDYLFNTVGHLDELELVDHQLAKLAKMVRALKA